MGRIAILNMRLDIKPMQVTLLLRKIAIQNTMLDQLLAALQDSIGEDCR
jgi:hypothetical protein